MKAVFLDKDTFIENISLTAISTQVEQLTCYAQTKPQDVISRCEKADIIITNKVIIDESIIAKLPQLKLVCIAATGFNNVDIKAAKQHNIAVTNVSGYAGSSVAQYVFAQLLSYFQQTEHHNSNTSKGLWSQSDSFCFHGNPIHELAGKSIGIIGYGNLGKAVANIALAFGMKVLISERPNSKVTRSDRVPFEEVIPQADIISLHCPQTSQTEKLINQQVLKNMKPTAVLINTARGALIDSMALLKALQSGELAFAILDVLEQEPPPVDHPLLQAKLDNLKITAHIAWASIEAQQRLIDLLSNNIVAFKNNESMNRLDLIT